MYNLTNFLFTYLHRSISEFDDFGYIRVKGKSFSARHRDTIV